MRQITNLFIFGIILCFSGCAQEKEQLSEDVKELRAFQKEYASHAYNLKRAEALEKDNVDLYKEALAEGAELNGFYNDLSAIEYARLHFKLNMYKPMHTGLQKAVHYYAENIIRYLLEELKVDPNEKTVAYQNNSEKGFNAEMEAESRSALEIATLQKSYYLQQYDSESEEVRERKAQILSSSPRIIKMLLDHGATITNDSIHNTLWTLVKINPKAATVNEEECEFEIIQNHPRFKQEHLRYAIEWLDYKLEAKDPSKATSWPYYLYRFDLDNYFATLESKKQELLNAS